MTIDQEHEVAMVVTDTPAVRVKGLLKTFRRANGTTVTPIDDVTLSIEKGEFLVLLGPSGCGKTTLLRCIAGLETPDRGSIDILGRRVFDRAGSRPVMVPPERRRLGMIFQSYALWPHLSVAKNVAYPLEAAKVRKAERQERVARALELVGVSEVAEQLPGRLSGGQQQRVALARALVAEPSLILFDEPLSNVDAKVREELRLHLLEMQHRIGFTAVYVTHDQVEAMELADRIAVLRNGKIAQLAAPDVVYDSPASRYVAKFIGTANELSAEVVGRDETTVTVSLPGVLDRVRLPAPECGRQPAVGERVYVIWRPERTTIVGSARTGDGIVLEAEYLLGRYLGAFGETIATLRDGSEVRVVTPKPLPKERGAGLRLAVAAADLRVFAEEAGA
ncbi:ABC transporter ATP-binding protein [Nonomuraea sp. NPDC005650]|uniref:ABC transporter ATP-binding protein n=1 Tax=Nonomuraea sp. NPDC005650 TaxID=3157045 RepID=UPI0033B719D2